MSRLFYKVLYWLNYIIHLPYLIHYIRKAKNTQFTPLEIMLNGKIYVGKKSGLTLCSPFYTQF